MQKELDIGSYYARESSARRLAEALMIQRVGERIEVSSLPFAPGDVTAGTENELQAEVAGSSNAVDLPVSIRKSRYFVNLSRRVASAEAPRQIADQLNRYLSDRNRIWENSWVRFPREYLSAFACEVLRADLESAPRGRMRTDLESFLFSSSWNEWIRVPISYLAKLALADFVGRQPELGAELLSTAAGLMRHFSNDLTSPETHSFYLVGHRHERMGEALATETGTRFLLTHLLIEWANKVINLESLGQKAAVHFAPHPPVRQQELNECISDSFYSELFVSPCLCGWQDGEAKREYMQLAYRTVSRSRINAVLKLRDAGLIPNNLVVLPNSSCVSLANNGTHLSLGSKRLSHLLSNCTSGFTHADEKHLGDLVIKISEHFLPLFVGTYTAAPYRLAFSDLHPERALGFLPHALDYSHLRVLWRHWKSKAHLRFLARPISPYGPAWLDGLLSGVFRVPGDLVPDYRLIDFPVAWLCTEGASALDGRLGNVARLNDDLDAMGVTDRRLKFYMPISLRDFDTMGFSGFEGRHYSVFEGLEQDLAPAAELQQLITILAVKYALSGKYHHRHIPDDPSSESERRLPLFCAALGLPCFNVRVRTPNDLLRRIVSLTKASTSSRHRGYLRVPMADYLQALIRLVEEDGADIIELLQYRDHLTDLKERLRDPRRQAYGRMLRGITGKSDEASALRVNAREFNLGAENYYRHELKRKLLCEALRLVRARYQSDAAFRQMLGDMDAFPFLEQIERPLLDNRLSPAELSYLIRVLLTQIWIESAVADTDSYSSLFAADADASIHRPAHAAGVH